MRSRPPKSFFSPIAAEWMSVCLSKRRLELFFMAQSDDDFGTLHKFKQDLFITSRHTDFEGRNLMSFDAFQSNQVSTFFPQNSQSVISSAPTNQRRDIKRDSRWVSSANKTWWCLNDFFSQQSLHGNRSTADYVSETRRTYRFAVINRRQKTPNGRQ